MINEDVAKEINSALEKDFPNTGSRLNVRPLAGNCARVTVTADIEALKAKLDAVLKGINLLKDQL